MKRSYLRRSPDASFASVPVKEAKPAKGPRKKTCATCKSKFDPRTPWAKACSTDCAIALVTVNKAKQERKADRERKRAMKTRSQWTADAQVAFNAFVRLRDQLAGHPCISSGKPLDWSGNNVDAGHYRSRGSAPHLRFDGRNCHAQSKQENRYASGNATDYRIGLITRLGIEEVERLECDQTQRNWTIPELIAIRDEYRSKLKQLQKGE